MPLEEVLKEQLQDLYDAEKQLTKALPRMAKAAENEELKEAFTQHLRVTEEQVRRIEQVFELLGEKAKSKPCAAMRGLVEEAREVMSEDMEPGMMDVALIGAGQRVEHYEMAGYGTVRAIAEALGQKEAAGLLKQTALEEGEADKLLTKIATKLYKEIGARGEMEEDSEEGGSRRGRKSQSSNGRSSRQSRGGGQERMSGSSSAGRGGSRSQTASQRSGQGSSGRSTSSGRSGARAASSRGSQQSHRSRGNSGGRMSGGANVTTDHEEIRGWAESRGAQPACVRGTGGRGDTGMIRLDFPGYSGAQSLQPISWDEWFQKFDENGLALIYQDKTAGGKPSNFNKLIARETAEAREEGDRSHRSRR